MVISHRGIRDPRIELMPGGSEKRTGRGLESISDWQWCFFLLDPFVIYVTHHPNLGKWFLRWSRYPKIISQNHFLFDHSKYRPLIFQNHFGRMFHFGTSHPSKSLTFNPPKSFPKDECWASKIISQADCYPFKIISLKNKIISSQHHNFNRLTPTPKSFQQVGWNSFEGPLLITT